MTVSIFSSTAPAKDRSAIYQHGYKAISNVLLPTGECTVKAFLQLGLQQYKDTIDHIRSIDDKNERNRLKTTLLPSGSLSVRLSTRESSEPLEKRIICYNPLLVLDFDNLQTSKPQSRPSPASRTSTTPASPSAAEASSPSPP